MDRGRANTLRRGRTSAQIGGDFLKDLISVKQAAALLDKSEDYIRYRMKKDLKLANKGMQTTFNIGDCYKEGPKRHGYDIYLDKVLKRMGKTSIEGLSPEKRRILE